MDNHQVRLFFTVTLAISKSGPKLVFSNPDRLAPNTITKALRHAFVEGDFFVATQIRLPELFSLRQRKRYLRRSLLP